jgi:hypothetical protein
MRTSRYLIVAAILFVSELLLGIGLIGIMGGPAGAIVVLASAQSLPTFRRRIQIAAVFLFVVFATFGWLSFNIRVAKQNAVPVINACEKFRSAYGHYPSDLNQLTPKLLRSVPTARYTLLAKGFAYHSGPPELCFAAMFHGVFCYDFQSESWTTND